MYCDYGFLEAQKAEGNTMDKLLDPVIYAHRVCSRDMPDDLTLALHLCRGNLPKGVEGKRSLATCVHIVLIGCLQLRLVPTMKLVSGTLLLLKPMC